MLAHKRLLIGFIIAIILIPTVSLLLSQRLNQEKTNNKSYDRTQTLLTEVPKISPIKDLLKSLENSKGATSSPNNVNLGPTLKLAISIEGRPQNYQHTKLFVGIIEGVNVTSNPLYLLSFNVDVPDTGIYNNISLVGLTQGTTYTAILKGATQIATSSAFIMSSTGANLNSGNPINLTTGDLNQDNIIDSSDLDIITKAYGTTPKSPNWNPNLDLDLDNVVNSLDVDIVQKNQGLIGATGKWYSTTPVASKSAQLQVPSNTGGYWEWIPNLNSP